MANEKDKIEEDTDLPWLQPADEEEVEGWVSTRTLVIGAGVFIVVFAGLLWVVYQAISGGNEVETVASRTEPPLIEAPKDPYKVAPEDPGGAEIPGRDKMVLEAADGDAVEPEASLGEEAEEPIEREAAEGGFNAEVEPEPVIEEKPEPVAEEPAPVAAAKPTPAPSGRYLLQMGAFSSDERARTGWAQIQAKYPSIVGDLTIDTELATVNGKTIYRLRGAAVATREEADRRCAALKAKGQGCLVIER